jgi:hypothetical protein
MMRTPINQGATSYQQVPTNSPTVIYPFKFKWLQSYDMGAAATTKIFEMAKAPIAGIILQFDMLGQGAAAVIASALTQCITTLKITDGGVDVTPNWSGAEWYNYLSTFYGRICPFQDGTAADNKLALLSMVIPFGRPSANVNNSLLSVFDQLVGFIPKGVPQIELSFPADGNAIDTRHLKVGVVYMNSSPAYTKKWTSWSSQTLNTTGGVDWILPNTGLLAEAFIYGTSAYNDTLTSDAPTLKEWDLTQAGKSLISDGKMFNMLGALIDTTPTPNDDYYHVVFSKYPVDDLNLMPKLGPDTRFTAYGGVADALKAAFATIQPA